MQKRRDWCFTSFDLNFIPDAKIHYAIWQHECCPTSGRTHIQGYVEMMEKYDFKTIQACLPAKAHIEYRKGSQEQAINYCMKKETRIGETVHEFGIKHKQGARNDLKPIIDAINNGDRLLDCVRDNEEIFIKFHRGICALINIKTKPRTVKPTVIVLWGKPGCGKTRSVIETYPDYYIKDETKWWDGYEQQNCILIDDYEDGWGWERSKFLRLLDRYQYRCEKKGSSIEINSPIICITSNYDPTSWMIWDDALKRRIDEIIPM